MGQGTLSAVIITYNEEKQIADCIGSVHDFVDEVYILDSHSTDATRSIAESFPKVRFETHDFDGHVQQKNRAMEQARGDWLLCIDADERVTPELAQSIGKYIEEHPEGPGMRIRRLTIHLGREIRHGGWYGARFRLIKRGQGRWAGQNPHDEIVMESLSKLKHQTWPVLAGDLLHYSFVDLSDQIETINKFSSIVAYNRSGQKKPSLLKMVYKPIVKFWEIYFFKLGFLDGFAGYVIAVSSAFSTFLKWAKLYEMKRTGLQRPSNVRPDYKKQTGE